MNEMMIKEFNGKQVRASLDSNGNPWFVAQDVCEVLGLKYRAHMWTSWLRSA